MKNISSQTLLDNLSADIRTILLRTDALKKLTSEQLNTKRSDGGWSIAQVLRHMNIYSEYYLHEIEKSIEGNPHPAVATFSGGWLGNYFTNLMLPGKDDVLKTKMKTPKNARPAENLDAKAELENFIVHQHHALNLLRIVSNVNLGKIRIPVSIMKMVKLKLGDTFRFYVAHEQRHMIQMESARKELKA